jgi:protein Mpv17
MYSSPIKTALRSSVLTALSSVIAQLITSYRKGRLLSPSSVDFILVVQFTIYASISSPLNYQWSVFAFATANLCLIVLRQLFLESLLPGQSSQAPKAAGCMTASDEKSDDEKKNPLSSSEKSFSMRNTTLKFILDQTVGAALNTIAFSASMALFRGANLAEIIRSVRRDFWPLMTAGLTVWPLFNLLCYIYIRSVSMRMLVGSLASMAWAVYITLATAVICIMSIHSSMASPHCTYLWQDQRRV